MDFNWQALSFEEKEALRVHMGQFVTGRRQGLIETVLDGRTRALTVVLENIYQPHNASAVLRSCDCFGVQNVQIIETSIEYRVNKDIALGAAQWLTLRRYGGAAPAAGTETCLTELKSAGYEIVATTLRPGGVALADFTVERPLALCFGTEEEGLSDMAHDLADHFVTIPMVGFTQSLNISVSAALVLYDMTQKLRQCGLPWRLTPAERLDLQLAWLIQSATHGDALVRHFMKQLTAES